MALSVKNLSKAYKIYRRPADVLKEMIFRRQYHSEFWALKDISFDLGKGEIMGVIGRNGAGKSTLLKILSGTLDKTSGVVETNGKISAILELGSGFHPEYTGRENIYMGGMVLGMSRADIERKFDSIVEFSELESFIDRPFKTYSTGMQTRLTFSVAINVDPEIFIIDEALAAGDAYFVGKCLERVQEICNSGTTVLFVSHNTYLVQRLCQRAIWIENGRIVDQGNAADITKAYERVINEEEEKRVSLKNRRKAEKKQAEIAEKPEERKDKYGTGEILITKVQMLDKDEKEKTVFFVGDRVAIRLYYLSKMPIKDPVVGIKLYTRDGVIVSSIATFLHFDENGVSDRVYLGIFEGKGYVDIIFNHLLLGTGSYFLSVHLVPHEHVATKAESFDWHDRIYEFTIKKEGYPNAVILEHPVKWKHAKLK